MLSNTLAETELLQFKNYHILHPHYHPKIIGHTLKKKQKNMHACIHENVRVIMMKMKMKMKNKSHRYDINKLKSKYKKCLSVMMVLCIQQHLSNI